MKLFLLILALGLLSLLLFPTKWHLGLAVGWIPTLLAEMLLAQRRLSVVKDQVRNHQFLAVMVFGFLGRLTLLFVGAILGAQSGLYSEGIFMAAALAAIFAGEAISLPQVAKATRHRRSTLSSSSDSNPPT
ncbi:MAG: hypothetical protein COA70_06845 [Planctomycetota bacterium]|nr:MAG: hypothetical protein COA70_06845 [Planctomycetota bacterium]